MGRKIILVIVACAVEVLLVLAFIKFVWNPGGLGNENTSDTIQTTTSYNDLPGMESEVTTGPETEETQAENKKDLDTTVNEEEKPSDPTVTEKETENKQDGNTEQTSPPTESQQPQENKEQAAWKKLYSNYVTINKNTFTQFVLVNIDGDDIPELYMFSNNKSQICAIRNDQIISLSLTGVGGGNYHKGSGHFLNVYQDNGYLIMRVYHLSNAFSEVFYGREYKTADTADYYIGDSTEPISEDSFKEAVGEYINTSNLTFLHENALSYDAFMVQMEKG